MFKSTLGRGPKSKCVVGAKCVYHCGTGKQGLLHDLASQAAAFRGMHRNPPSTEDLAPRLEREDACTDHHRGPCSSLKAPSVQL